MFLREQAMIRIPVDFNAMNKAGTHVWINTKIHATLIDVLKPDMRVILYESYDMQVEATIEIEENRDGIKTWYGVADWSTRKDLD